MANTSTHDLAAKSQSRTIDLRLPCQLSERELKQAGQDAAREVQDLGKTEDRKKEAVAQFGIEIKRHNAIIRDLSEQVRSGIAYRHVECEETRDYSLGMVRVVRLDTMDTVETRPMTRKEMQKEMDL